MARRVLPALWLSFLIALVGGSAARTGGREWSPGAAVERASSGGIPETYLRAAAEWHTVLDARPRKDHPPIVRPGLLPADSEPWSLSLGPSVAIGDSAPGLPTPLRGQFPTFTTGPPSHA